MKYIPRYIIILVLAVATSFIFYMLVSLGTVHEESMLPNYKEGDKVLISKALYKLDNPEHNDVIALKDYITQKILIKRVIAIEGDRLQITLDGKVKLNDKPLDEPYIYERYWNSPIVFDITIPEGTVFVMGDNRNVSYDSRGPLSLVGKDQIIGKIIYKFHNNKVLGK